MSRVLWSGRSRERASDSTLAFTSSIAVDSRLAAYDVLGSLAHVQMLEERHILSSRDRDAIVDGLREILHSILQGEFDLEEGWEDIHSAVEFRLTERIGEAGGRLHTGRSRNDQVATDLRLFLRDVILDTLSGLMALQQALLGKAEEYQGAVMPGFTHLQHAQPITTGFHLMAHCFRLQRDAGRLMELLDRVNLCPLGSAALAGTVYDIDREMTASLLGFDGPTQNAMDSVSDRDPVVEYCFAASLCMVHLSSLCEELIVWSSPEFGFARIADEYTTGSSIMPQKRNPDVAELIRGRSGPVMGDLNSLLFTLKGLPFAYNRDLQEDKGPLYRASDTLNGSLSIMAEMVDTLHFDRERMREAAEGGFINATDLADYLVEKGMPFRKAHQVVTDLVQRATEKGVPLERLDLEEMRSFSDVIEEDVKEAISVERCVRRRSSQGGTAPQAVAAQMETAERNLESQRSFLEERRRSFDQVWERLAGITR
ncbi:MAG: argininosuccinate lyase [Methanomassiliicoccales archaeon]